MTATKRMVTILLGVVLMSSVAAYSQATDVVLSGKWDFASAQVVEKNQKTGKIYTGKTFFSANEIADQPYAFHVPVSMEFFGKSDSLMLATVRQVHGFIENARAILSGGTLLLFSSFDGSVLSPEKMLAADLESLLPKALYENVRMSDNTLSLEYIYTYEGSDEDTIEGVMTITFTGTK